MKKSCLKIFSCLLKLEVLILIADCGRLLMFRQTEDLSLDNCRPKDASSPPQQNF